MKCGGLWLWCIPEEEKALSDKRGRFGGSHSGGGGGGVRIAAFGSATLVLQQIAFFNGIPLPPIPLVFSHHLQKYNYEQDDMSLSKTHHSFYTDNFLALQFLYLQVTYTSYFHVSWMGEDIICGYWTLVIL